MVKTVRTSRLTPLDQWVCLLFGLECSKDREPAEVDEEVAMLDLAMLIPITSGCCDV